MINWFKREKVSPMHVVAGDTIAVHYYGADGRHETISHPIVEASTYDTLAIGKIENELGFEEGLVGVIGRTA